MTVLDAVCLVLVVVLAGYLVVALLRPEYFG